MGEVAVRRDPQEGQPSEHFKHGPLALLCLDLAPATGTVVRDHCPEQLEQSSLVEFIAAADLDTTCGRVPLALVDEPVRIGCDRVVDEDIEMVLGAEEGTDVAVEHEVRSRAALDHLRHARVGLMEQTPNCLRYFALPRLERVDVFINRVFVPALSHSSRLSVRRTERRRCLTSRVLGVGHSPRLLAANR